MWENCTENKNQSRNKTLLLRTQRTRAAPHLTIFEIQGAGHVSAFDGQEVRTSGIVTALDRAGFYLQDPEGDGDDATSDAIFVFSGNGASDLVSVGDAVELNGIISEFIPGGAGSGNLSTTQLSNVEIEVTSSGNALPAATILGAAGRTPQTEVVISEGELPVNLQDDPGTFNPETDGIDFYESLEGMLVTVDNPTAVSATNRFGETWVAADDGASVTAPNGGLNDRGGLNIHADADETGDLNPERVQIQYDGDLLPDGSDGPAINLGDDLSDITGIVDFGFGNFEIRVTEAFEVETPTGNTAEVAATGMTRSATTEAGTRSWVAKATMSSLPGPVALSKVALATICSRAGAAATALFLRIRLAMTRCYTSGQARMSWSLWAQTRSWLPRPAMAHC